MIACMHACHSVRLAALKDSRYSVLARGCVGEGVESERGRAGRVFGTGEDGMGFVTGLDWHRGIHPLFPSPRVFGHLLAYLGCLLICHLSDPNTGAGPPSFPPGLLSRLERTGYAYPDPKKNLPICQRICQ